MPTPKQICVVTGSRAEYGLLNWVMGEIDSDPKLELQILVTGMHLSEKFGSTWKEIENDGFEISAKVEMLEAENTSLAVARSTGKGIIGCADALDQLRPDLLVVLGDRFETFAAATAATFLKIPVAHFHGGETTEGAFDESLRHSITKMSHLHFTATEGYRRRVIQLGEAPERVFNVGAVGLDNIERCNLLDQATLEKQLGFTFRARNLMVTFHPVTLESNSGARQFSELLAALEEYEDCGIIITHPNADPGSHEITDLIEAFVARHPDRTGAYESLGSVRYLSTLKMVDAVVGNSSSGLIEVPHFKIGTVNIGERQKGRIAGATVIHCKPETAAIKAAIEEATSSEFRTSINSSSNPYGEAGASKRAVQIIKCFDFTDVIKKKFYDVDFASMPSEASKNLVGLK